MTDNRAELMLETAMNTAIRRAGGFTHLASTETGRATIVTICANEVRALATAMPESGEVYGELFITEKSVDLCPISAGKLPDSLIRERLGLGTHKLYASPPAKPAAETTETDQ